MNLIARITRTATRLVRDIAQAPAVTRQLAQLRTTDRQAVGQSKPAPRLVEVDIDPNDIPQVADIEAAAREYEQARTEANAASRLRRRAERILKRTPNGTFGQVVVERVESSRQTADLDAIRAIFAELGRDVPMKTCGPSITVAFADEGAAEDTALVLAAA
jgi:pyruvate/2-oxoglutarate dehydrogenase complex dihydrolipoamide acyltransferase (E2) component